MCELIQRVLLYIFGIAGVIGYYSIFWLAKCSGLYKKQAEEDDFFHLLKILTLY